MIDFIHNGVLVYGDLDGDVIFMGFDDYIFINVSAPTAREKWYALWHRLREFIRANTVPYGINIPDFDDPLIDLSEFND